MLPFDRSAKLYDVLYADLPTAREIDRLLARLPRAPRSVLDLGCGTGRHAQELARRGVEVVGVDRSPAMVAEAKRKNVDARVGDLVDVRLGRTFDLVISLFHVFAYATSDEQMAAFVATARAHLAPSGSFVFDGWSRAAVRATPPEPRTKIAGDVVRTAVPELRGDRVVVRYTYRRGDESFDEVHEVRPIDEDALALDGFRVLSIERGEGYDVSVVAEAIVTSSSERATDAPRGDARAAPR